MWSSPLWPGAVTANVVAVLTLNLAILGPSMAPALDGSALLWRTTPPAREDAI